MDFILLTWISIVIFGGLLLCLTPIFYHKETEKIIAHLTEAGFIDMAQQLDNVVRTIGKLKPYDSFSKEGKIHNTVWTNFEKMVIPRKFKVLHRYQLFSKGIHIFSVIIVLIFFSLPVFGIISAIVLKVMQAWHKI